MHDSNSSARAAYDALIEKVTRFGERVMEAQGPFVQCRRGCDDCCRVERSAWAIEIDAIAHYLAQQGGAELARLRDRRDELGGHRRCVFLEPEGSCAVYPARPIICRTHGPAVTARESGLIWCALNFAGMAPEEVLEQRLGDSILDLDLLNRMLVMINQAFIGSHQCAARQPLGAALDRVEVESVDLPVDD